MTITKQKPKSSIFLKTLFQMFLLISEAIIFPALLVCLSKHLKPFTDWIDILERFALVFTFYQVLVYIILGTLDDIETDSYLALKSNYELALLYCKYQNCDILNALHENIESQLDPGTFNPSIIRQQYEELLLLSKDKAVEKIEYRRIFVTHRQEEQSLAWKHSFLLRLFK